MNGTVGGGRGLPPSRVRELARTLGDLARLLGGKRLTDGQDLRALPAEEEASLQHARSRFDVPEAWRLGRRLTTVGDVAVVEIRDGADLVAVLKLSRSPAGDASLALQQEVLSLLAADDRLGEWRRFLPEVLAHGVLDPRRYMLERAVRGRVGTSLPDSALAGGGLRSAVLSIAALHRATGGREVATRSLVESWVDPPLARIADLPMLLGRTRRLALVDDVRRRIRSGLEGRAVWISRTHGDLSLGNVIYRAAAPEVAGILDWAQSRDGEPAWIDPLTLLLVGRAQRHGRELGDVVRDLRRSASLTAPESDLLMVHRAACPGDRVDTDVMALMAWLRHVDGNLEKSPRYAAHPVWVHRNVERVLTAAAASHHPGRSGVSSARGAAPE